MAKGIFTVSNHYYGTSPTTDVPITFCVWVWRNAQLINYDTIMSLATNQSSLYSRIYGWRIAGYFDEWYAISQSYTSIISATVYAGGVGDRDKWTMVCGVFAASDDRKIYYWNGSTLTSGSNTTDRTIGYTKDRYAIGTIYKTKGGNEAPFDIGYLSRASFWNIALTENEVTMIAKGYSPLKIQPENLISYTPIIREAQNIVSSSLTLTEAGTVPQHEGEPPISPYSGVPL
jgi:hypothetical protein